MPAKCEVEFPLPVCCIGVPPGPLYGQLSRGQAVMGANGRLVQPCEVMDPPQLPGPLLLVLDCPSERHVAALPPPAEVLSKYAPEVGGGQHSLAAVSTTMVGGDARYDVLECYLAGGSCEM